MRKLTPWFKSGVKPARVGVYQTDVGDETFQYWNGYQWGYVKSNVWAALFRGDQRSSWQRPRWRGLAKEPK